MTHRACLLALALAACSHKADRNLPAPPKDSGVTLAADGDATIVTDPIAGFEVRFPGTPELSMDAMPAAGQPTPTVVMHQSLDHGLLMVMTARMKTRYTSDGDIAAMYGGLEAAFRDGNTDVKPSDVTLLGHGGKLFTGKRVADGKSGVERQWVVYLPEHDALVIVIVAIADGASEPGADHFIDSLKASAAKS